jgi:ubiquinone/menaquinone biosynthesis C-methylase UbiE
MNVKQAYDAWADQYDANENKTRDLEAMALRSNLASIHFEHVLEVGCGTGKNTTWIVSKAKEIMAVDLSEVMLARAKEKISSDKITFRQADIRQAWTFLKRKYDLVTFSLVLEHIDYLDHIFQEASRAVVPGGHVYVGELHPFKQYMGTKARFETSEGQQVVTCFDHNVSDFTQSAAKYGLNIIDVKEYFDNSSRSTVPRILTLLFKKD